MTDNASPIAAAIDITENLARILEQENALLRARKPREISALITEKARVGQQLRLAMDRLRRHHPVALASPQDRARLQTAGDWFHQALQDNGRLLGTLKKVSEGLVQAVADEALRQVTPLKNYGQGGRMSSRPLGPATLSLNQVV